MSHAEFDSRAGFERIAISKSSPDIFDSVTNLRVSDFISGEKFGSESNQNFLLGNVYPIKSQHGDLVELVIMGDYIGIPNISHTSFGMMGYKTPNIEIDRNPAWC